MLVTEDTAPEFEELKDEFGNTLTETTFTDGEFGTIYRSSTYDNDGNNLIIETDARGNNTVYTVDPDTSRNTLVTDRCGNKTAYEYDKTGKTAKVTSKAADDTELANVSYAYDTFDNMTEILRGDGMKYLLGYNAFHELESIGVDGMDTSLIHYDYKNGNGRLKSMTYANGDKMKATYNNLGQMIAETWYDKDNTVTARYKYAYDTEGNIVRSIDISANKEYDYIYSNGNLERAVEYDITVGDNDLIIARSFVSNIFYTYDSEGNMTKKRIVTSDGHEQTVYYEHPENSEDVVKFTLPDVLGGVTRELNVTSHSKTDSFGRKVFDELQFGTASIGRRFSYYNGKITSAHDIGDKIKSLPTTQLVEEIVIASTHPYEDDRILSYEYDNEERITKVTDSVDGVTLYTYDALGQLASVYTDNDGLIEITYDNYGNIIKKNNKVYTYDSVWKDLLISYDGRSITYDAQGNPTSYLGHELKWTKGRQLKKYDNFTYTYNANGIRTSKDINGEVHTYDLEGTKIIRESWVDTNEVKHTLVPLYDNEDSVCGITYNDTTYFFVKNLQGDVIALLDSNGKTVVRYTYDAWGCQHYLPENGDGEAITADTPHIANINPFRYRGYYYDNEIGLYYVSSRYYDPEIGRFLNSDDPVFLGVAGTILSYNLFAYCENNIVNDCDSTGMLSVAAIVRFVKTIGSKAWKIITSIWKAFVQPGKINLKPFEIVIDVLVGVFVPSLSSALKLLTYKAFNKKLVQIAFKNAGKSFINLLTKLGVNIGLNTLFAAAVNNLIFKHMSRFLTVGGIICLVFDVIDGKIDYWFNYGKFFK